MARRNRVLIGYGGVEHADGEDQDGSKDGDHPSRNGEPLKSLVVEAADPANYYFYHQENCCHCGCCSSVAALMVRSWKNRDRHNYFSTHGHTRRAVLVENNPFPVFGEARRYCFAGFAHA